MDQFSVKNFKAVNKEKTLKLAPINLIVGPNGSGKSSFIRALALSKQLLQIREVGKGRSDVILEQLRGLGQVQDAGKVRSELGPAPRLNNPYHRHGLFEKNAINFNCDQKDSFRLSFPLHLPHFPDSFSLRTSYEVDARGNAFLFSVEVWNNTNNCSLYYFGLNGPSNQEERNGVLKIDLEWIMPIVKKRMKWVAHHGGSSSKIMNERIKELNESGYFNPNERYENEKILWLKAFESGFYEIEKCNLRKASYPNPFEDLLYKFPPVDKDDFNLDLLSVKIVDKDVFQQTGIDISELQRDVDADLIQLLRDGITINVWRPGFHRIALMSSKSLIDDVLPTIISGLSAGGIKCIEFRGSKFLETILRKWVLDEVWRSLNIFQKSIDELVYLPPIRAVGYWSLAGGNQSDISDLIVVRLNEMQYSDQWSKPLEFFVNYWLEQFGIKSKVSFESIADVSAFINIDGHNSGTIADFGFGIGQLVPIVCMLGLFNNRYSLSETEIGDDDYGEYLPLEGTGNCFLIEEPEANLHPNFQSKIADLLIDASWKFGHQFVVETHSEYMVRKFQYWVAKGKISTEDVKIFYVENKNDDPEVKDIVVTEISIEKDGSLSKPFGKGFFDEADRIAFDLFKLNQSKEGGWN